VLINLTDSEVKFVIYSIQESTSKLISKLEAKPVTNVTAAPSTGIRLTKAGRPAKRPGRKPGKKPALKTVQPIEQAA
jgi:hypothetical protein